MLVNITTTFDTGSRIYRKGENVDVPRELAAKWIADGYATLDTDGKLDDWSAGSGSVAVQDEGTPVEASAARLNFTGAGVTATSDGGGGVNVDIPGGGAAAPSVSAETTLSVTTSATAGDAAFAVFADTVCTELVIDNNTGVDIEAQRGGTGPAVLIPAGQRRRVVGLSNANQIGVRRAAYTDNIARTVTVVARTLTSTQTFTVAGSLSVPISSGGGGTRL